MTHCHQPRGMLTVNPSSFPALYVNYKNGGTKVVLNPPSSLLCSNCEMCFKHKEKSLWQN